MKAQEGLAVGDEGDVRMKVTGEFLTNKCGHFFVMIKVDGVERLEIVLAGFPVGSEAQAREIVDCLNFPREEALAHLEASETCGKAIVGHPQEDEFEENMWKTRDDFRAALTETTQQAEDGKS